jgi:hypothetical protein
MPDEATVRGWAAAALCHARRRLIDGTGYSPAVS